MSHTKRVLRFIQETHWPDLPLPVQQQAKRCLLDGLGSLLAGTRTPVAHITADLAREQFPGQQATLLGQGEKVSAVGAALANGFAANALDADDGHRMIKGHPGSPLYPILLASSEMTPASGQDVLTALVIGYEVGIRAGLIRHNTLPTYHSSGSWGAIAGAAAGGRLLGLDEEGLREALGTADYHAPLAPMMRGIATPSMGKDSIGWGCLVAMSSLLLARRGFTGIEPLFQDTPREDWMSGLGHQYEIMNVYFKPYCGCRWAQPAVSATLSVMEKNHLEPEEIEDIHVFTFQEAAALSTHPPGTTEEAQYNMALPIAAALLDGEVGPEQVLPPRIQQQDVLQMMSRVQVTPQEKFSRAFPTRALARVELKTKDGKRHRSETHAAPWDPDSRLPTDRELEGKFQRFVTPLLGKEQTLELQNRIWNFEKEPRAETLIQDCCPA